MIEYFHWIYVREKDVDLYLLIRDELFILECNVRVLFFFIKATSWR